MCTSSKEPSSKELVQTVINHIVLEKLFSTFLCFKINKRFELIFWLICLFCIYMFTLTQACYQFPKLWTDTLYLWIIFKGTWQVAFPTKLKFKRDFPLSFFKIDWMKELQSFNKFFFWRTSGFPALRVDRDVVCSLIGKMAFLFIDC